METKQEQSSEEAQEALAAAEVSSASESVQEPTVPLHEHTALRTRAQDAEVSLARAQGQLDALSAQRQTDAPAALSPLEVETARQMEEDPDLNADDVVITAKTYKDQKLYEQQTANQVAESAAASDHATMQGASAVRARIVHDDYDQVIRNGENLLTKYQKMEVLDAGKEFGEVSYAMCRKAIEASKPALKSSEQTDEEKVVAEAAAKLKAEKEAEAAIPSQEAILSNVSLDTTRVMNI